MKLYSNTPFIDSLELEVKDVHGEKKLERMFEIANIYIITEKLYNIGSWIEAEATKQKNQRYIAASYNLKARHYLQRKQYLDSVIYYGRLANEIYADNNIKDRNQGHLYIIDAYLEQGYYALAITYLKNLLAINNDQYITKQELNNYLSTIYVLLEDYETSLKYLEKEKEGFATLDFATLDQNQYRNVIDVYLLLVHNYYFMKKYNEAFKYVAIVDDLLQSSSSVFSEVILNQYLFKLNTLCLDLYFDTKETKQFQISLNKLKQVAAKIDLTPIQKIELKSSDVQHYFLIGDYEKVLPLIDECIDSIKSYPAQVTFIKTITKIKIEVLKKLGQLNEALATQTNLVQYEDSLYRQNLSTLPYQITELSETHQLTEVRLEHEKDQAILMKSRTINISLIIAFVVLGVMFYILRQNLKKTREKNKFLVKQYTELEMQKDLLKGKSPNRKERLKESTLFEEIETYIEQNEAFRDSTLNRESLAKVLNTNEMYVAKAIKQMTGKTFVEYINQYRLEYSCQRLLAEPSEPVKIILQDAGFSSDTSFYRLFKEAYGMSSSEMRQAKEELDKENGQKE